MATKKIDDEKHGCDGDCKFARELRNITSKADTPEELALWIWRNYVGIPAVGAYAQEYEHLIERIRRLARSEFTTGLRERRISDVVAMPLK